MRWAHYGRELYPVSCAVCGAITERFATLIVLMPARSRGEAVSWFRLCWTCAEEAGGEGIAGMIDKMRRKRRAAGGR